jgi:hypothetical protein
VPGIEEIEALTAAAQDFDATPLGLRVDSDAEAAVRESLRRTGLVLLGELHGVAQTPVLVEELIAWFGLGGVALEWPEDLKPWLDQWIKLGVLTEEPHLALEIWGGDGRIYRRAPRGNPAVGRLRSGDHSDGWDDARTPAVG